MAEIYLDMQFFLLRFSGKNSLVLQSFSQRATETLHTLWQSTAKQAAICHLTNNCSKYYFSLTNLAVAWEITAVSPYNLMLLVKMFSAYQVAGTDTQSQGRGCTKENSGPIHAKMRIISLSMCAHKHTCGTERERAAVGKSTTPLACWHSCFTKVLLNKLSTLLLVSL